MPYRVPSDAVPDKERGPFAELRVEIPVPYYARAQVIPEADVRDDVHCSNEEKYPEQLRKLLEHPDVSCGMAAAPSGGLYNRGRKRKTIIIQFSHAIPILLSSILITLK